MLAAIQLAIGLTSFLSGMRLMSNGLRRSSGQGLQNVIGRLTGIPIFGALIGAFVTAILQSSSATTVMVIGAVDAKVITLRQAFALIAGANIGTTITAQIIALDLVRLAGFMIIAGLALFPWRRTRNSGIALLGLGLLFWGLKFMEGGLHPLAGHAFFRSCFLLCEQGPYFGLMVGLIATALVQSSSIVTGVTIGLAQGYLLSLPAALAITIGSNVGTCVTAFIAALGGGKLARQTAWVHLSFNLLGVALIMPFFGRFVTMVADTGPDLPRQIANGHTLFNVFSAIFFLALLGPISSAIERRG